MLLQKGNKKMKPCWVLKSSIRRFFPKCITSLEPLEGRLYIIMKQELTFTSILKLYTLKMF